MNDQNKAYKITLADGSELNELKCNGNMFISSSVIEEAIFKDNCSPVVIYDGETEDRHEHMVLGYLEEIADVGYVFYLRDLTEDELYKIKTISDIEYLAMMTDVDL